MVFEKAFYAVIRISMKFVDFVRRWIVILLTKLDVTNFDKYSRVNCKVGRELCKTRIQYRSEWNINELLKLDEALNVSLGDKCRISNFLQIKNSPL